jgi:hypothetical protein
MAKTPPELVRAIVRDLLAKKLSARGIALKNGVSHQTVIRIRDRDMGQMGRCPGCGGLVSFPCRLCAMRAESGQQAAA